jgi:hypothetical protein
MSKNKENSTIVPALALTPEAVFDKKMVELQDTKSVKAAVIEISSIAGKSRNLVESYVSIARGLMPVRDAFTADDLYGKALDTLGLKGKCEQWLSDAMAYVRNLDTHPKEFVKEKLAQDLEDMILGGGSNFKGLQARYKAFCSTPGKSKFSRAGWIGSKGGEPKAIKKSNTEKTQIKADTSLADIQAFIRVNVETEDTSYTISQLRALHDFIGQKISEMECEEDNRDVAVNE